MSPHIAFPLILWSGFAAGSIHVLTGPDHIAALLPLSVGHRWRAWALGARWGIGHSAGVLVIAIVAVALRQSMDLQLVSAWSERLVGVMLIGIGGWGVRRALRDRIHAHGHSHGVDPHAHLHAHTQDGHEVPAGGATALPHAHRHTAFFAGILHGAAGTAHLVGVLAAAAFATALESGVYLGGFALGTILAMAAFAAAVGATTARASERAPRLLPWFTGAASVVCMAIGVVWIAWSLRAPAA